MTHLPHQPFWVLIVSTVHGLAWSVYVGGAICMELVLRYAQKFMKPSQVAVVCQKSGRRYRWWSLFCLLALLVSGILLANRDGASYDPRTIAGFALWGLIGLWAVQMFILGLLSFRIHPDMHARLTTDMTPEQMKIERARVGVAISRMDTTVRIELFCAIVAVLLGSLVQLYTLT